MNARIPPSVLNADTTLSQVSALWDAEIVPQLQDYIRIPAKSPMFDADWATHGYLDTVVRNTAAWIEAQKVSGLGINTAHELGHKRASLERWLSKIALAQTFYGHFFIEHTGSSSGVAMGLSGGMLQMISHGFISGALFLCVGVLYDRMHSRKIADYGGVVNSMPRFAAFMVLFALANAGLPGTSGFVGEFRAEYRFERRVDRCQRVAHPVDQPVDVGAEVVVVAA